MNDKFRNNSKSKEEPMKSLSPSELKGYNGGGWITETIAFLKGAWDEVSKRMQMTYEERQAFIKKHGMRDHW
jgi:hypothetical protein